MYVRCNHNSLRVPFDQTGAGNFSLRIIPYYMSSLNQHCANCMDTLSFPTDGCIMLYSTISSCQSAAISIAVKPSHHNT